MDASRRHVHTVAVVGAPNTGKSTFFNRLSGASARVANWPGMTVDITTARVLMGGEMVKLADLPGVYSLDGHSEDEALVQRFLGSVALDAIVAVVNATRIELQLPLVLALEGDRRAVARRPEHGRRGDEARRHHRCAAAGTRTGGPRRHGLGQVRPGHRGGEGRTHRPAPLARRSNRRDARACAAARSARARGRTLARDLRARAGGVAGGPHGIARPDPAASVARDPAVLRRDVRAVPGRLRCGRSAAGRDEVAARRTQDDVLARHARRRTCSSCAASSSKGSSTAWAPCSRSSR